jgi:hypothetical protein
MVSAPYRSRTNASLKGQTLARCEQQPLLIYSFSRSTIRTIAYPDDCLHHALLNNAAQADGQPVEHKPQNIQQRRLHGWRDSSGLGWNKAEQVVGGAMGEMAQGRADFGRRIAFQFGVKSS